MFSKEIPTDPLTDPKTKAFLVWNSFHICILGTWGMFQQTVGIFLDSSGSPYTYHQNQPIMEVNIQVPWIRHGYASLYVLNDAKTSSWIFQDLDLFSEWYGFDPMAQKLWKVLIWWIFLAFFQASNKQIQENVQILQVRNLQGSKSPPFTSIWGDFWNFFSNRI